MDAQSDANICFKTLHLVTTFDALIPRTFIAAQPSWRKPIKAVWASVKTLFLIRQCAPNEAASVRESSYPVTMGRVRHRLIKTVHGGKYDGATD